MRVINVTFVGEVDDVKTNLILRYVFSRIEKGKYVPDVFYNYQLSLKDVKFVLSDTSGYGSVKTLHPVILKKTDIFVIVVSFEYVDSFEGVKNWIQWKKDNDFEDIPHIICGVNRISNESKAVIGQKEMIRVWKSKFVSDENYDSEKIVSVCSDDDIIYLFENVILRSFSSKKVNNNNFSLFRSSSSKKVITNNKDGGRTDGVKSPMSPLKKILTGISKGCIHKPEDVMVPGLKELLEFDEESD